MGQDPLITDPPQTKKGGPKQLCGVHFIMVLQKYPIVIKPVNIFVQKNPAKLRPLNILRCADSKPLPKNLRK